MPNSPQASRAVPARGYSEAVASAEAAKDFNAAASTRWAANFARTSAAVKEANKARAEWGAPAASSPWETPMPR